MKPVSFRPFASRASTTGSTEKSSADPLDEVSGTGCVVNISCVATTSDINAFPLTVGRSVPTPPWSSATSVKDSPSTLAVYVNPENVATPEEAVAVPFVSAPADPSVSVTTSAKPVSFVPFASRASTTGCPLSAIPLTEPDGCVVNTSCVATTSDVSALALTVGRSVPTPPWSSATSVNDSPSALAVYVNPENVATPEEAVAVPFARLPADPSVNVTVSAKAASTLPLASCAFTTGWPVSP